MEIGGISPQFNPTDSATNAAAPGVNPSVAPADTATSQAQELNAAAETAFASVFFSMLQNILAEAQNNSGS